MKVSDSSWDNETVTLVWRAPGDDLDSGSGRFFSAFANNENILQREFSQIEKKYGQGSKTDGPSDQISSKICESPKTEGPMAFEEFG